MKKKCEIISLGANCLVRTILTEHKIKPSKAEGELSYPFDLAVHPITTVIEALENNFETYFEGLSYHREKKKFFGYKKKHCYWKKSDGTFFNHDRDCKAKDLDKITQRIKNRITNLNNAFASNIPLLFVIYLKDEESRKYVNRLYDALRQRLRGGGICDGSFRFQWNYT